MTMRTRTPGGPARRRPGPPRKIVEIPRAIMVRDLAAMINASDVEAVKALMKNGIMANINQVIDFDTAVLLAAALGWEVKAQAVAEGDSSAASTSALDKHRRSVRREAGLEPRPPVITIMGHVDHGKTSLLDSIRQANVTAGEAGGITQHIGAYQVEVNGQKITFLDTPGHEAFTAMRARGAQITDIAVLVVAADDGVMPQTREAINHAKAAEVPIVVAINKIDLPNANPDRIKQELTEYDIVVEEYGGDTICVEVSAKTGQGVDDLLENLLLLAEVLELRADPDREALGVVVEASMDQRRGALATLLVQTGTLEVGDAVAAGTASGRIKNMFDDRGHRLKKAGPSTPASILGLNDVPGAGDVFRVYKDEKAARAAAQQVRDAHDTETSAARAMTLDDFSADVQAGAIKDLNVILKTDVQGSIDPIRSSLEKLSTDEVRVRILDSGSGNVTENDVNLAIASKAVVIGFNNTIEPGARRLADAENVDVRLYNIIYKITEEIEQAVHGLLEPKYIDVVEGRAEVRQIFRAGRDQVAGSRVVEGKVTRGATARVLRNGEKIADSVVKSLRRFKDDVREVTEGLECGIVLESYNDFAAGDIMEFVVQQRV